MPDGAGSSSLTQWTSALNIDSLSSNGNVRLVVTDVFVARHIELLGADDPFALAALEHLLM